jgi:lipopolysaccharide biosynthesis glycosyltransferase
MSKNLIFQYMITENVGKRKRVKEYDGPRDELYKKSARLSWDSFAKYAKLHNVTHHTSSKRVFTEGCGHDTHLYLFEVLRLVYDELYDQFDNVLYVDSDVICNTRENIFDLVDGSFDMAGIYESEIVSGRGNGGYNSWDRKPESFKSLKDKYDRLGIPVIGTSPPAKPSKVAIFNTGVMLWTKEARLKARETFDDWFAFYKDGKDYNDPMWVNNDQPFISSQLMKHNFRIKLLNQTWNDTPAHYSGYEDWKDQNFLHYTGGNGKALMLDHHSINLFKYI